MISYMYKDQIISKAIQSTLVFLELVALSPILNRGIHNTWTPLKHLAILTTAVLMMNQKLAIDFLLVLTQTKQTPVIKIIRMNQGTNK
jgi:hypothetical protein